MDSNQKRFIVDVLVVLDELREGLLQLETNPDAAPPREQIFRAMHTIRGGANMFGFNALGELTQRFEALYKLVCQDKTRVSKKLLYITSCAFDHVRALLNENDLIDANNNDALRRYIESATNFLNEFNGITKNDLKGLDENEITVFVRIVPLIEIPEDGKHPVIFILQELEAVGTVKSFCYKKENDCVAHWDLFLATTETQEVLESHFLFIGTDCYVTFMKLSSNNIFDLDVFQKFVENIISPIDESDLVSFVNSL